LLVVGVLRRLVGDGDGLVSRPRGGGRVGDVEPVARAEDDRAGPDLARARRLYQVRDIAPALSRHDLEFTAIDEEGIALGEADGALRLGACGRYGGGKRDESCSGECRGRGSNDHGSLRIAGRQMCTTTDCSRTGRFMTGDLLRDERTPVDPDQL